MDSETALKIVMTEIDDFEKLKQYWSMSYEIRSNELLSKFQSLYYVNMFPGLNQPKGYELVILNSNFWFL